jgi:hypothetical protein
MITVWVYGPMFILKYDENFVNLLKKRIFSVNVTLVFVWNERPLTHRVDDI